MSKVGVEDTSAPVRTFTMLGSADDLQVNGRLYSAEHVMRALDTHDEMVKALTIALDHIEHMASWISAAPAGYSFESLGEDLPNLRAALARAQQSLR